ncbi:L-seryl-tRNA(Sec) selenium transferase [Actinocorallia sp. A-T 12471]|uniref:L-seryl-tRNA(Sec) selenium transferase n=1 Tax=Actinocorallia sp. A-T 12471 TaxID=3089813 RepID=UPI0029D1A6EA|nr:L-seryl-tRNA(Sec) selenium transferase [Actinocorallia sp. A-T 12471]MDX6739538.1 L-seryl-tRNA(Sec) selenium transferase [Actinocorallia sp. A-T 12471]
MDDVRRLIPRTDALLADERFVAAASRVGRERVKAAIGAAQEAARAGRIAPGDVAETALAGLAHVGGRAVLNATGVILHTNLGRAPLSAEARRAVAEAAGCTDVELDLATGRRGARGRDAMAALAAKVPDAGGVHVVNNNAAALVLAATALAAGREIVIARGELVEIGAGFRLPELLESTGARLREVGTTNRTTVRDYASVLGPETGFVLKVHPSNYRVVGFTSEAAPRELAALCREADVPFVGDIGSGLLAPDRVLPDEPDAATWLRAGADLVTASGDKLLGGPQCGLLLGRADLVERLRRHPLARALRVDKLTLAALEASLLFPTPTAESLHADPSVLRARAESLAAALRADGLDAHACDSVAVVGGGGAPGVDLPSAAVSLPASYAAPLRTGTPAVLARLDNDRCLLDLRALPPTHDPNLLKAIRQCT